MKRILSLALALVMVLSLAACGGSNSNPSGSGTPSAGGSGAPSAGGDGEVSGEQAEWQKIAMEGLETSIECEPIEISLACSGTVDGTVGGDAIYGAIDKVKEWTGGNFIVNFYPGGQLGGDVELIEAVQMGTVDVIQGAPTSQVTMIPELAVLDIGGLFKTLDQANAVFDAFYDDLDAAYGKVGLRLADMYTTSFRLLTSNKEINTAADLQKLNIRVQENPYHMTFWGTLGCNPTPLAFGELYIALQQGLMDAQENPIISIYGPQLYEVQKYIYESNHIPFVNTMVMNKAKYESLSDAQKLAMDQFFTYIRRYTIAGNAADDTRMIAEMEATGNTQYLPLTDEVSAQFEVAADAVIKQMKGDGKVDAAFIDAYVAAARGN